VVADIHLATQNMLLADRALGLPPDWHSRAILPIGHPMGRFGAPRRLGRNRL
jgi:hypothetical protein